MHIYEMAMLRVSSSNSVNSLPSLLSQNTNGILSLLKFKSYGIWIMLTFPAEKEVSYLYRNKYGKHGPMMQGYFTFLTVSMSDRYFSIRLCFGISFKCKPFQPLAGWSTNLVLAHLPCSSDFFFQRHVSNFNILKRVRSQCKRSNQ